jgi:hypothetical protein
MAGVRPLRFSPVGACPVVSGATPYRNAGRGVSGEKSRVFSPLPTTWPDALDEIARLRAEVARLKWETDPLHELAEALHLACGNDVFTAKEVVETAQDVPELGQVLTRFSVNDTRRLAKLLPACGFARVGLLHGAAIWLSKVHDGGTPS